MKTKFTGLSRVQANEAFFRSLKEDSKVAADILEEVTQITIREEGLLRRVWGGAEPMTYAGLNKFVDSDKPQKICEKDVNTPLSFTTGFGALPPGFQMNHQRYVIPFGRTMTRKYNGDLGQIQTYDRDIRDEYKEKAIADLSYAEDIPAWNAFRSAILPSAVTAAIGTGTLANPQSALTGIAWNGGNEDARLNGGVLSQMVSPAGKIQFYDFRYANMNPLGTAGNGLSRENFVESMKIMQRGFRVNTDSTPIRNKVVTCVMNANTSLEFAKWDHDERGGPKAADSIENGIEETTWLGTKFIYTIKDDIIPDGEMWMFAANNHIGHFYELEAPTVFMETRAFLFEFFVYGMIGMGIGNPYSIAMAKLF